jgi:hypothetical protein
MSNAHFYSGLIYMNKWKSSVNFTKKYQCIFGASHHFMWLLDLGICLVAFYGIDVC